MVSSCCSVRKSDKLKDRNCNPVTAQTKKRHIKKATQGVAFKSAQSDGALGRTSSETLINLIIINFQAVTLKVTSCH